MALVDQVREQFASRMHFGVPLDSESHFVATYYPEGDMLLEGEGREMPPFVLFRGSRILISSDGTDWHDTTDEAGGLAVLALLDPRRVVDAESSEEGAVVTVNLVLLLSQAGQSSEDVANVGTQLVEFKTSGDVVTEMVQNDVAESEPPVAIRFAAAPQTVVLPS